MIDLPSLIAFSVLALLWFVTLIYLVRVMFRNKRLTLEAIQLKIDMSTMVDQLQKLIDLQDNKAIEETDGFMRFMSESRDWAFQYIEDVQSAIEEYRQIADVIPLSKDMTVQQAEQLSSSYDRLMNFLPEENLL